MLEAAQQLDAGNVPGEGGCFATRDLDNRFTQLRESFKTQVLDFTSLNNLTPEQVLHRSAQESPLLPILRKLCVLTQTSMIHMNQSCPGLPPDSVARTLELITHKGARVVVLTGVLPDQENEGPQILGYGVVMIGRDNIIDTYHIPDKLLEQEDACRVIRLFVTKEAREFLPRGEAFSKIIDQIKILSGDGLLIGMVLTDITASSGEPLQPRVWLDAMHALEARGFEKTGFALPPEIIGSVAINFEWWTWSKQAKVTGAQARQAIKIQDLDYYKRERLAPLVPALPLSSGLVLVHGRATHGYDFANAYPGNLFIAPSYESLTRPENAHNLIRVPRESSASYVEPEKLDAVVAMGIFPDMANVELGNDAKAGLNDFISKQHRQLKVGGSFVIRDSIAPEVDELVQIRLGLAEAALWQKFIEAKVEPHILPHLWQSIRAIHCTEDQKQTWITPLSVAMEFMNKFPYAHDWEKESHRCYTTVSAEERVKILENNGFRILYDAPVESKRHEQRVFENKVELLNLHGEAINYPAMQQITIAEKIESGQAVNISIVNDEPAKDNRFLLVKRYEAFNREGKLLGISEIVTRQKSGASKEALVTLDVLPFFTKEEAGAKRLYFGARVAPRPLLALEQVPQLNSSYVNVFHIEQVAAILPESQLNNPAAIQQSTLRILEERAKIKPTSVRQLHTAHSGYTRPDAVDEAVVMQAVETSQAYWEDKVDNPVYALDTRPKMKTFEAGRYLQGCQRGIFQDRRLELMVYSAGHSTGVNLGNWLGEVLPLTPQANFRTSNLAEVRQFMALNEVIYKESHIPFSPEFFEVRQAGFQEKDAHGETLGVAQLEYVKVQDRNKIGTASFSVLPVSKQGDEIYVGLEIRNFLGAYLHSGTATLMTIPTFRIPSSLETFHDAAEWTERHLARYFGASFTQMQKLGGKYLTSPGVKPETIQIMIGEVDQKTSSDNLLQWVSLKELLKNADDIRCLQLRLAVLRAGHMYGLL